MKKRHLIMMMGTLLITGCGFGVQGSNNNYSLYEYHIYDDTFEHTEEFVAKYDEDGKFKLLEVYMVYDKVTDTNACKQFNSELEDLIDLEYPDVTAECTIDKNGLKKYFSMTDKSVAKGYLKDKKDYKLPLKYSYDDVSTEEKAKESFQKMLDSVKEEGIIFDDKNYIIIDGERIKQ